MASLKQIAANRTNALNSTGPRTPQGKAKSRLNATRHSLTGQVLVLTAEDREAYRAHCDAFAEHYQPRTPMEALALQQMADIRWRMNRIVAIESNLFALTGHRSEFSTGNEQVDRALGQADAVTGQIRSLATLSIYEQRLQRQFEEANQEFEMLQRDRRYHEWRASQATPPPPESPQEDEPPADDGSGPAANTSATTPQSEEKEPTSPEIGFVCASGPTARRLPKTKSATGTRSAGDRK
jgi:hypothetical protein